MSNLIRGLLNPKANPSRNGFDKTQSHKFTAKAGIIKVPVCEEMVAGSHFKINVQHLTRTQPLNTAAFVSMKENFDFVFVPYSLLWHSYDEFLHQVDDYQSAIEKGHKFAPTFALSDVLELLYEIYINTRNIQSPTGNNVLVDVHGYNAVYSVMSMMEMLGYGYYLEWFDSLPGSFPDMEAAKNQIRIKIGAKRLNLFAIAAYQKVWDDFYRDSMWNPKSMSDVQYFNLDDIPCTDETSSHVEEYRSNLDILKMFIPRYHTWHKDMFMGGLPNAQFGSVSVLGSDVTKINYTSPSAGTASRIGVINNADGTTSRLVLRDPSGAVSGTADFTIPNLFNVMALKKAEVLQNWKIARMRAGNRLENVADAMTGMRPKHMQSNHCEFIGSVDSSVMIDEVLSTSDTANVAEESGAQLGAIGGKAISSGNSQTFEYTATESGVLMCLYYIQPRSEYDNVMLAKQNKKYEAFDYFNYHFEDIGFDALPVDELSLKFSFYGNANPLAIFNYLPRYYDYKTAVDKIHGELMRGRSLSDWTASRIDLQNYYGKSQTQ